jgi:hypothetical protein
MNLKKLKPYLYLAADFFIILAGVAVFAAAFFGIGWKAAQSESINPEVERAAWETFAGREGK